MVVQSHVAQQRLLQVLCTVEAVASQHIGNAPVKALDHAIGARRSGFGQPVLNAQACAQLIELMFPCGLPGPRGKEAISELLAVVGEHLLNAHRAGLVHGIEKRLGTGRRLVLLDLHEHPARGAVDGHEQVAPTALVLHLRQVLQVQVQVPRLVGLERLARGRRLRGFERVQVASAMAAQTAIQARAGGFWLLRR